MTVPLTGAGGLFTRLGHVWGGALDLLSARGSGITSPDYTTGIPAKWNNVISDLAAGTAIPALAQGGTTPRGVIGPGAILPAVSTWQAQQGSHLTYAIQMMAAILVDMVATDVPPPQSVNVGTPTAAATLVWALTVLANQMQGTAHLVPSAPTVGTQTNGTPTPTGAYSATGNSGPVIVLSAKDGKGRTLDNVYAEGLTATCTSDSQSGGRAKFGEAIQLNGAIAVADLFSALWPGGSGSALALAAVNAALNNSGGTLLVNGEFTAFTTANIPDNWTVVTGTPGTHILQQGSGYADSSSLQFAGDGSTLAAVVQRFGVNPSTTPGAGGTAATILQLVDTPFGVNFWVKTPSTPAAGQIQIDLVDNNNTVINDDAGTANSVVVDLTSSGINNTSWNNVNAVFRVPAVDPSAAPVGIRIWQPTGHAITSGKSAYVDRLAFTQMQQLYPKPSLPAGIGGGLWAACFSGNIAPVLSDQWILAITTTWGNWLQALYRALRTDQIGVHLPTAGGSAIDDTVGSGHLIS
jgi:hypothetical protein